MISLRLKEETLQAHQALESLIVRKIKATKNKEEYAHMLSLFYGYYLPIEANIEQFITAEHLPDIEQRRKADWLLSDMRAMDSTMDLVALCNYIPEIKNEAQAMGAMYVLEGSTLGGIHIINMFKKSLGLDSDEGFQFYNSYGEETGAYWGRFTTALNAFVETHGQEDEIIKAANDTFTCFGMWLRDK